MRTIDLSGRRALILGVANKKSLAWAIAQSLGDAGAQLAFSYAGDRLKDRVEQLATTYPGTIVQSCDVTDEADIEKLFATVKEAWGGLDTLVHSVAFAPREALDGDFLETTAEAWRIAQEVSAYSLIPLCKHAAPLMSDGGSVVALTYMASQRVVPRYNVMGSAKASLEHAVRQLAFELGPKAIRVNAISAGPVQTLSARGVGDFNEMFSAHREKAPLRRSIEPREVGDSALFLCSEMGSGITGEILYVDAGYNILAP